MIELKRLNVIRRVENEAKAVALEAQGFKRLPTKGKEKPSKKGDSASSKEDDGATGTKGENENGE